MPSAPETITIPWWKPGGTMIYNRDGLDPNHPESTYNYVKKTYNVDPELYGIDPPAKISIRCPHCMRTFIPDKEGYGEDYLRENY
jgi:hypothetical protein